MRRVRVGVDRQVGHLGSGWRELDRRSATCRSTARVSGWSDALTIGIIGTYHRGKSRPSSAFTAFYREIPDSGGGCLPIESPMKRGHHGPCCRTIFPDVPAPQDVCRYVALHLGISEASARDMILLAAVQDAERSRQI